jgi:hypothetical protein
MTTAAFPIAPRRREAPFSPTELKLIQVIEAGLAITAPLWFYALFFPTDYAYGRGLILGPLLICGNLILVLRMAKADACLRRVLPIAYLAKLAAAGVYLFAVQHLFRGGDLLAYHEYATRHADIFIATNQWWRAGIGTNTEFILSAVTGLYIITGSSIAFGIVLFATLAFWGEFLIYRACCITLQAVNRGRAALLLLLFPSIVFWSASIGKEALLYFTTGLIVYGIAQLTYAPTLLVGVSMGFGFLIAGFVRPHVAALLAVSLTATYFFTRNVNGTIGIVVKMICLPLLVYGSYYAFHQATQFLNAESVSQGMNVIQKVGHNSAYGGSVTAADQSMWSRLLQAPFLLFRPFPWEVNNFQAAVASAEGVLLFYLLWSWRGDFIAGLRRWRADPTVLFSMIYCIAYSIMLAAAMSNIGLIARQRVLMAPFALMLFCTKRETRDSMTATLSSAFAASRNNGGTEPLYPSAAHKISIRP